MTTINELLDKGPAKVINIGLDLFAEALEADGVPVVRVDWKPPAGGDARFAACLAALEEPDLEARIDAANQEALGRLVDASPALIAIATAASVIPDMKEDLFLHAGPPIEWERMCGPMRGAVIGGLLFEGRAGTPEEAEAMAASDGIAFSPCHHHSTVGPMAGVVTPSMPVFVVEDRASGRRAFCTMNEGLGKVLRYGAFSEEVIDRLQWMKDVLAPVLQEALDAHGPLDLRALIAQALLMGDEGHNRNRAATSLLIRELAPILAALKGRSSEASEVLRFMDGNDHFFLNLSMPACKCAADGAAGIKHSTVITAMARNGTDFGIRVSDLGEEWFIAPASRVEGLYFPGFGPEDANLDIGDSTITETAGIGGFVMASAPAIVQFVGGSAGDALRFTRAMYGITAGEHQHYRIPALDFRGSPTGIDVRRIVETGVLPAVNTGIAHREPGVGQVGAGLVEPPFACFAAALARFAEKHRGV